MLWSVNEWEKSEFINQEISKNTDTLAQQEGLKQLENREQRDIRSSLQLGSFSEQDTEIFGGVGTEEKS